MTNLSKMQDSKVFLVFGSSMFSICFLFWATGQHHQDFAQSQSRITLTAAGCEYVARHTDLPVRTVGNNGACEVDTDFTQSNFGGGGNIFYGDEDSKLLQISDSQLIGTIRLPDIQNRTWTKNQQVSVWLLVLAIAIILSNLFFILYQLKKPTIRKSDEH